MQKLYTFVLLVWTLQAGAQSPCYIPLTDASGYTPTQAQLNELEAAACRLRDSLPAEFQSSFKVFDFGFYLHNETTTGGYPEAFQMAIQQAQNQSEYYLLFGKQTDQNGMYTKFWVDLVLPDTGGFECIDLINLGYRESIELKMKTIAENNVSRSQYSPHSFYAAEIECIDSLISICKNIINCCDPFRSQVTCNTCLLTHQDVLIHLKLNDYIKIPIDINIQDKMQSFECGISARTSELNKKNDTLNRINNFIINHVDYNISYNNTWVSIDSLLSSVVMLGSNNDFNVYIMDLQNIYDNSFFVAEDDVRNVKGGLIYFIDNYSDSSYLYISPTAFDLNLFNDPVYIQDKWSSYLESNNCTDCPDWIKAIWNYQYDPNEGSFFSSIVVPILPIVAADGPAPVIDLILGAVAAGAISYDISNRWHITYIARHLVTGKYYCGRSSGFKLPDDVLKDRFKNHHLVTDLYTIDIDKSIQTDLGYVIIRGREQQNIDYYGGAILDPSRRSDMCENKYRGVRKDNPLGYFYHWASSTAYGEKYAYTGYGSSDIDIVWDTIKSLERIKRWIGE